MFDDDKIYNLLASGRSAEDIVAMFTNSINDAEKRLEKEKAELKAREEAVKARKVLETARRTDFMEAVESLLTTIGKYYPAYTFEITDEITGPIADLIIMSIDLEELRDKQHLKPVKVKMADTNKDVFKRFFEQFGLS